MTLIRPTCVAAALSLAVVQGCVYYNTFFSARKHFRDGMSAKQKTQSESVPANAVTAFEKSIEKCLKVIADYPESKYVDDAILLMGKALFEKGSYPEAVKALTSLATNYPESDLVPEATYCLGLSYSHMENYDSAIAQFLILAAQFPDFAKKNAVMLEMAEAQFALERFEEAHGNLELFLESSDDRDMRDRAMFLLAQCEFHLGRYDEAMQSFSELAERTSSFSMRTESSFWLASSLSKIGDHERAISTLRELMKTDLPPDDLMEAQEALAGELSLSGMAEEALEEYRKLAVGFPNTDAAARAWYRCGLIALEDQDDLGGAKKHFASSYREAPSSEPGKKAHEMCVELTRYERFEDILEADDPEKGPVALFLKAEFLLLQMRESQSASEAYARVVEKYPESTWAPKAAYAVALIYETELGDTLAAQAAYREVISRYDGTRYADYSRIMLGMDVVPKETAFYEDELEGVDMIPEYYVHEDDLFRYLETPEDSTPPDTTQGSPPDTTGEGD
jgi:TolA-binding protein